MIVGVKSEGDTIDAVYQRACFNVLRGELTSPRGMLTREIIGHQIVLHDLRENVMISTVRDLNYRFMVAEWLWILTGLRDVETIAQYNSQIRQFSDDGVIFNGAYGPRVTGQLPYVLDCFRRDKDTRQAIIEIWKETPGQSKDIPCTLSIQFLVREDRLHSVVTMRSSDVWLGLPYDMYNFAQLTNYVASMWPDGMKTGSLVMNLGSSHVYEKHFDVVENLVGSSTETIRSPRLSWPPDHIYRVLRTPSKFDENLFHPTDPWLMYAKVLASKTKREALENMREFASGGGEFMK